MPFKMGPHDMRAGNMGFGSSTPTTPSEWILTTGFWDDAGAWDDTADWNDGP